MQAATRDLVVSVVQEHADGLLRVARRHTSCAADAEDAYQRALEIFVKNAHRLDPATAYKWLYVVVRHEALAVRRARSALVGVEDEEVLDAFDDGRHVATVEERSERADEMARAAEALQRLKPQEVTALWLKAQGLSYDEIAERQGWTYTKVNRCITEGRRAFMHRYAGIEAGEECERWSGVLNAITDGEVDQQQLLEARPHLRNCPSCRASLAAMHRSGRAVAALLPVGAVAEPDAVPARVGDFAAAVQERAAAAAASLHERATTVALKAQAAADVVLSGKAAAVAASAAAIAGGGVAVERQVRDQHAPSVRRDAVRVPAAAKTVGSTPAAPPPPRPSSATRRDVAPAAPNAPSAGAGTAAEQHRQPDRSAPPADAIFAPEVPLDDPPARAAGSGLRPEPTPPPVEDAGEFGLVAP